MVREKKNKILFILVSVVLTCLFVGCIVYITVDTVIPSIRYSMKKQAFFEQLNRYEQLDREEYVLTKMSGQLDHVEAYGETEEYRYVVPGIPAEDMYYYERGSFSVLAYSYIGVYLNPESAIKTPVTDMKCYGIEISDAERNAVIEVDGDAVENIRKAIDGVDSVEFTNGGKAYGFEKLVVRVYLNEDRSFYWTGSLVKFKWYPNSSVGTVFYEIDTAAPGKRFVVIEDDGRLYDLISETFYSKEQ